MLKEQSVAYYGNTVKLALALGITQPSVSQWGKLIPEKQALRLDRITSGALLYNAKMYRPRTKLEQEVSE